MNQSQIIEKENASGSAINETLNQRVEEERKQSPQRTTNI